MKVSEPKMPELPEPDGFSWRRTHSASQMAAHHAAWQAYAAGIRAEVLGEARAVVELWRETEKDLRLRGISDAADACDLCRQELLAAIPDLEDSDE